MAPHIILNMVYIDKIYYICYYHSSIFLLLRSILMTTSNEIVIQGQLITDIVQQYTLRDALYQQAVEHLLTSWVNSQYRDDKNQVQAKHTVERFLTFMRENGVYHLSEITPIHSTQWQATLNQHGLAASTIYAHMSRVSSFFNWMIQDKYMGTRIHYNPVRSAQRVAPKPYAGRSLKTLNDHQVQIMLDHLEKTVRNKKLSPVARVRAYRTKALFLWLLFTGVRRSEVLQLRWGDLTILPEGGISFLTFIKGGETRNIELSHPDCITAFWDYLRHSGRMPLRPQDPIWYTTGRNKKAVNQVALSGRELAYDLKAVAVACEILGFHVHTLRHTYARLVHEVTDGNMTQVQEALNHKNPQTTKNYIHAIVPKKDQYSSLIGQRFRISSDY